jgi:hypothetical protein
MEAPEFDLQDFAARHHPIFSNLRLPRRFEIGGSFSKSIWYANTANFRIRGGDLAPARHPGLP